MAGTNILSAIVCDHVRVEATGKHILIGVYTTDIVVPRLPIELPLMLWLQIDGDGDGENETDYEFRFAFAARDKVKGGFTVSRSNASERVAVPLGHLPVEFDEEGELRVDLRIAGAGRWRNHVKLPVKLLRSAKNKEATESE